jgi:hypothetical protein
MVETFLNIEDLSYLYPLEMWAILFGIIIIILNVHTRGGGGIRTSDLRCMRRGPQPIELPIGTVLLFLFGHKMYEKVKLKTGFEYFRFLFGNQLDQNIDSNELSDIQAWYKWAEEQLSLVWDLFSHISPNFKK